MIGYGTAAASAAADLATTEGPSAAQLDAYTQAWQQGSPQTQAWTNGSPAALGNDALNWLTRLQPSWQSVDTDPPTATDVATAPPAQAASTAATSNAAATSVAARLPSSMGAPLHLMVETYDYAFREAVITQAVYQFTGSVSALVKQP